VAEIYPTVTLFIHGQQTRNTDKSYSYKQREERRDAYTGSPRKTQKRYHQVLSAFSRTGAHLSNDRRLRLQAEKGHKAAKYHRLLYYYILLNLQRKKQEEERWALTKNELVLRIIISRPMW
jgi:hypothetical protein